MARDEFRSGHSTPAFGLNNPETKRVLAAGDEDAGRRKFKDTACGVCVA